MRECVIEIRKHDQQQLVLAVQAGPGPPKRVSRPMLALLPDDMDQLRGGQPAQPVVDRVTAQLSEWLLKPDPVTHQPELDLGDMLGLNDAGSPPARLVFDTREVDDDSLLFRLMDLPLELLVPTKNGDPLVIHNRVAALVHYLRKAGQAPASSRAGTWPLRVLIVRSNPQDLGGAVPRAAPLREHILAQRPDGPGHLMVDLLTSEDAPGLAAGRPTRLQLLPQLEQPYDILVYLGHGDVREVPEGQLPVGMLLLENEDGSASDQVDAKRLSGLLQTHPVPVVLLVGCLTAAELRAGIQLDDLKPDIPRWMRGSQGVAQALVNGHSGVQLVVGMRYRVENQDAIFFLKTFFTQLLRGTLKPGKIEPSEVGNVEAAVRRARSSLHFAKDQIGWAAPVVFRTPGAEPTFGYLASPPVAQIPEETQALRAAVWETLKGVPWGSRPPMGQSPLHPSLLQMLRPIEAKLIEHVRQSSALLMPERVEVDPATLNLAAPETTVTVPVVLHGPLSAAALRGQLVEGSGLGRIIGVGSTPGLDQSGFELFTRVGGPAVTFRIQSTGGDAKPLPAGALLEVRLAIGPTVQMVYTVGVQALTSEVARAVCGGNNAVIVPPP